MNGFTKVAALALITSGLTMPTFAQSNSNGSMSVSSTASNSSSMSSGAMSGSMSDHSKMTAKKKKTGAMTNGSMSGSMSNGSMSGSMSNGNAGH